MDNNNICEYSGLPNTQSYVTNPQAEGAGVGGESIKENFIDSSPNSLDSNKSDEQSKSASVDSMDSSIDWMYNWIKKHKNR